ncbi:hypothetical protein AGMMS49525_11680 [Bacteroidia bacterium]|nr:hypothetical protein AGMMS49525_11630 [Bacteroidia bacterium]GHT04891.1 hypothetical protein AGMMS49525_11680 [Bacteroidia bacterium]
MAFTIQQYEALKNAIVAGVHSVTYGDKTVSYRSISEMKEALNMMEAEVFPERIPRRRAYASFDSGYFSNCNR